MTYYSECGFTLSITRAEAASASHAGQCDADVLALSRVPRIARQLAKLDPAEVAAELRSYGAWNDEELSDHDANLQRILWLACGSIVDGNR